MKKMAEDEKKVSISVAFDRDVLKAAESEATKGRISRSAFINIAVNKVLYMESRKARPT
jgi:metal-responsive CopG/Arc/MetJ family transcriptional regulator